MRKLLGVGLLILATIFLVACNSTGSVSMPEVKGQEVSMTEQQLTTLVTEAVAEDNDRLTTELYMNMDMSMNATSSNVTNKTTVKMNISGKQGFKQDPQNLELISDMKMDVDMKVELDNETISDVKTSGDIGFYYTEETAYVKIAADMSGSVSGVNSSNKISSKTYREVSIQQVFDQYVSVLGIGEQVELSTSFADLLEMNMTAEFKVYQDGNRYSIVYDFDRDAFLEQLETAGLSEQTGIEFGNLDSAIGQFIVIIENDKVVDAGVNVSLDINMTMDQMGISGTGHIKMTMQARYSTDASRYPALPSDLDSYQFDEDGDFGFSDLA